MSTSYVQDRKAPGAGTKVNPDNDAPVTRETAGHVASESLAAESYNADGGFASNRNAEPENYSSTQLKSPYGDSELSAAPSSEARRSAHDTTSTNAESYDEATNSGRFGGGQNAHTSSGGTAPSYVADNYLRDPDGPHGKNLTEGGDWDENRAHESMRKGMRADVGSINDPGREAEDKFQREQNAVGGDAGPRQSGLTTESQYDELNRETPA